jgi:hypothetical protein
MPSLKKAQLWCLACRLKFDSLNSLAQYITL